MLYLNLQNNLYAKLLIEFNFNKCCIWIKNHLLYPKKSALFNFNKCCIWIFYYILYIDALSYLTLTNVVFELTDKPSGYSTKIII